MLIRILFFIVLIGAVVFMLRRGKQSNDNNSSEQPPSTDNGANKSVEAEQMVPCEHCGVHLPQTEALEDAGSFYCSQQHIDEAKRNNDGG